MTRCLPQTAISGGISFSRDGAADPGSKPGRAGRDPSGFDCQGREVIDKPMRVVLDMGSTEIPVYGQQEQSA
jgi:hypothetical protein